MSKNQENQIKLPNCTDYWSDLVPGQLAYAVGTGNELTSDQAKILYYFQLVFALYYHEQMDKC